MKFRSGLLVGLGAGYVLGTKAGRERYQQIVEATRAFLDNPGVQRLTDEVGKTVNVGKERVSSATSRKVEQVGSSLADQDLGQGQRRRADAGRVALAHRHPRRAPQLTGDRGSCPQRLGRAGHRAPGRSYLATR